MLAFEGSSDWGTEQNGYGLWFSFMVFSRGTDFFCSLFRSIHTARIIPTLCRIKHSYTFHQSIFFEKKEINGGAFWWFFFEERKVTFHHRSQGERLNGIPMVELYGSDTVAILLFLIFFFDLRKKNLEKWNKQKFR